MCIDKKTNHSEEMTKESQNFMQTNEEKKKKKPTEKTICM